MGWQDLLLPTTNPPSSDSNTPSPAAAQETEESEQYNSTEPLEILQGSFSTEAPPDMVGKKKLGGYFRIPNAFSGCTGSDSVKMELTLCLFLFIGFQQQ